MLNRKLLCEGLSLLGIDTSPERLSLLERYHAEIELWNPKYGLVRADGDDLLIRHFFDSLAGLPVIATLSAEIGAEASICDVGSGAGFPGIPLSIFLSRTPVTLIESSGRRTAFLRNVVSLLSLRNVSIEERRAEDPVSPAEKSHANTPAFDIVTFRAFRPLENGILKTLLRMKSGSGWIAAYKGRADKIREELEGIGTEFSETRIVPLAVPFLDEERHLVLFR